jgi:hypothetical protein
VTRDVYVCACRTGTGRDLARSRASVRQLRLDLRRSRVRASDTAAGPGPRPQTHMLPRCHQLRADSAPRPGRDLYTVSRPGPAFCDFRVPLSSRPAAVTRCAFAALWAFWKVALNCDGFPRKAHPERRWRLSWQIGVCASFDLCAHGNPNVFVCDELLQGVSQLPAKCARSAHSISSRGANHRTGILCKTQDFGKAALTVMVFKHTTVTLNTKR